MPNDEVSQIEIARDTGKILKTRGLVLTDEPKRITLDELDKKLVDVPLPGASRLVFAANSRSKADRTHKVLGVRAKAPGFLESLEGDLLRAAGLGQ